jgi:hypothetical protein
MGLGDFDFGVRMTEAIYKIAQQAIQNEYPRPRYATVVDVNNTTKKVAVQYPDEGGTFEVPLPLMAPVSLGAVVRIAGFLGTRYIEDVISGGATVIGAGNSFVNLLDNSQHALNQRGLNSITIAAASTFLGDRWQAFNNTLGTSILARAAYTSFGPTAPSGRPQPATVQYIQQTVIDGAPAVSDYLIYFQRVEGKFMQHLNWGTSQAKPVTVSFDVYSTQAATYVCELSTFGATTRSISQTFSVPAGGSTFTTVTLTFPGDTSQAITDDELNRWQIVFWIQAGTTYTSGTLAGAWATQVSANRAVGLTNNFASTASNVFSVINIQCEIGVIATSPEVRPLWLERTKALRYYEQFNSLDETVTRFCMAQCISTTAGRGVIHYEAEKRAVPVMTLSAANTWAITTAAGVVTAGTAVSVADPSLKSLLLLVTVASGMVAGNATIICSNTVTTAKLEISSDI